MQTYSIFSHPKLDDRHSQKERQRECSTVHNGTTERMGIKNSRSMHLPHKLATTWGMWEGWMGSIGLSDVLQNQNTPKHKHTDTRHQREVWGQVRATGASRCLFRSLAKSPSVRLSAIPLALLRCWFGGYKATEGRENDGDIVVDELSIRSLKLSYFENVIFYF